MSDVKQFPIRRFQRWRNSIGKRAVPCIVSSRYLVFPERSDHFEDGEYYPDGDYMFVKVVDGNSHKTLSTLCISKQDLLAALDEVDNESRDPLAPTRA